jgi:eukaryotic-like serine/threonine-protein kinase
MPLAVGTRLGPYEVLSIIGAGGMGEVYRARDPHLNRDVALKILPAIFALEPDRVARFKREAQVLASLNHPHIAAIYGFAEANGVQALALELVEGPTLADRIARGPIPLDEALAIARQIAAALEVAHEQGIVHRDLKPANVKLRPDGTVKVLDFGLAKTIEPGASSGGDATASPTITSPAMTQMGLILGTAAYMSPEQAKGRPTDKRSDVWSFGVVFHEMLSGQRTFKGEDIADTLAAVLRQDVDWTALPAPTPASVRSLIARCLERDVKQRLRDIGEARIALDQPSAPIIRDTAVAAPVAPRRSLWGRAIALAVGAITIAAVVPSVVWYFKAPPPQPVTRFSFTLPEGQTFPSVGAFGRALAMSPDGTQMVYVAWPGPQLYLKSMSQLEATRVAGTEIYEGVAEPAFSPDGRSIAFMARSDRTLKRIPVTGGAAATICAVDGLAAPGGLSWSPDGIVFGMGSKGVMRVSPDGGTPEVIVRVKDGEEAYGPVLLPGGTHVLFTLATGTGRERWDKARIVVQSITSGESRTLIEGGTDARYVPTGHLVYALSGLVYAVAFDVKRLEIYGPRVPVIQGVRRSNGGLNGAATLSLSSTGSVAYVSGPLSSTTYHLIRADRKSGIKLLNLPPGSYAMPRVSPDGKRIAFGVDDGKEAIVYTYDLDNGPLRRLTYGGNNRFPIWSADSTRVAFQSDRDGDLGIWWQPIVGGQASRLTRAEPGASHAPESWSPTGQVFLYSVTKGSDVSVRVFSFTDKQDKAFGNVHSSSPTDALFSPDGRWVAYTATERNSTTIYVQPFPETGDRFQLVAKGSDNPHEVVWSPDGRELLYNASPGTYESVSVTTTPVFTFGNPVPIMKRFINNPPTIRRGYDMMPNGEFLGIIPLGQETAVAVTPPVLFVLNWYEELKRLVPTR